MTGDDFEILIAGGGVAGLTAGLFAARAGRRTGLLLGDDIGGGHLLGVGRIEDFPGFPEGVPGFDLCPMLQEQAQDAGVEFVPSALKGLEPSGGRWTATTGDGEIRAGAVIVATGSALRELGVPGESRLRGHGVSDCATCDGPLHRGNTVAVVGGGDSALLEALELTNHVGKVLLLNRGASLDGQRTYVTRVEEHPSIEVRHATIVEEILGDTTVSGVRVTDPNETTEEQVTGVFVYVGLRPRTDVLRDRIPLDADGRVPTDGALRTALPGVFAAGDIRTDSAAQAITAAGDGATAALAAHRYLTDPTHFWPVPPPPT
ncbi:thioredoxin reductase (NADPH) [Actinomadura pelletieri DSM 43383]|uniref:Thioredoxin reductase (NADPH) n=1 Tax=Actinomadura pelletieri DSM 43383 TaxID=1120940 RepID=A0A495QU31_9ACTN|nr:FAD-dependent oxidoreductase [Actinomadura pelletieri]RKS76965.1 thioredoxin reductase (NADPH) [Actinomadura pelletieri DSM 43383]